MSFFHNVREEYEVLPWNRTGEKTKNPYWEGLLKDKTNKADLKMYDFTIEDAATFFDNLDIYTELFDGVGVSENDEQFKKIAEVMKDAFEDFMESERNVFVTSMLDNEYVESEESKC